MGNERIPWNQRLRYRFDNYLSRGILALVIGLFLSVFLVIGMTATVIVWLHIYPGGRPVSSMNFWEALWISFTRTISTGAISRDDGWHFRLIMLFVSFCGIFIFSSLIGVLSRGLQMKIESLRKGRSRVLETGHFIILGWSPQIYTIIHELIDANNLPSKFCIVIMCERDKVELEDEVHFHIPDRRHATIVCRTGNPISRKNLEILNIHLSKAIMILNSGLPNSDTEVIKTLLAITNSPIRPVKPYHIIAEVSNPHNYGIVQLIGKEEVEIIKKDEIIARIIAQCSLQSGLSVVYNELFSFVGSEIYLKEEPGLYGMQFGYIMSMYESASVFGVLNTHQQPVLNPGYDYLYQNGEKLILIAHDEASIIPKKERIADLVTNSFVDDAGSRREDRQSPLKILLVNWNLRAEFVIRELDAYVPSGSSLLIATNFIMIKKQVEKLMRVCKNLTIDFIKGVIEDRDFLNSLDVFQFNHIIVLPGSLGVNAQEADANIIITLLYLRDIAQKAGFPLSIVSEMMDSQNCQLAEISYVNDFIVSERWISLLMAQIAFSKQVYQVIRELLDVIGSEVYLKEASLYVELNTPIDFYSVLKAFDPRYEIPIGYKIARFAKDPLQNFGLALNPNKSQLITFSRDDKIIVIASEM